MSDPGENIIDFITGEKYAGLTFTSRKHINRIKKLHSSRPEDFEFYVENKDGSIYATVPVKWIKINPGKSSDAPKREMSKEQKAKLVEAAKAYREKRRQENNAC